MEAETVSETVGILIVWENFWKIVVFCINFNTRVFTHTVGKAKINLNWIVVNIPVICFARRFFMNVILICYCRFQTFVLYHLYREYVLHFTNSIETTATEVKSWICSMSIWQSLTGLGMFLRWHHPFLWADSHPVSSAWGKSTHRTEQTLCIRDNRFHSLILRDGQSGEACDVHFTSCFQLRTPACPSCRYMSSGLNAVMNLPLQNNTIQPCSFTFILRQAE